jgi:hypothetical protein
MIDFIDGGSLGDRFVEVGWTTTMCIRDEGALWRLGFLTSRA